MWGVIFPHPCLAPHSFSHPWDSWNNSVGYSRITAWLMKFSPRWHIVFNLSRRQIVQNTIVRIVAQKSRFDHITPSLSELHWLPVCHRINFKIATIPHGVLQFQQPSYRSVLIPRYAPVWWSLRSSSPLSISVPLRNTSMATSRSFSSVAPKIWN